MVRLIQNEAGVTEESFWSRKMASDNANMYCVKTEVEFNEALAQAGGQLVVLYFFASWSEECTHMDDVLLELSKEFIHPRFIKVEAEEVPEITGGYGIEFVPTFVLLRSGKVVDKIDGANAPLLTKKVQHHSNSFVAPATQHKIGSITQPHEDTSSRLHRLINKAPCMLFMKGSPSEPKCGFSRQIVDIFKEENVEYDHFDILQDEEVRQGLKTYSNWPTYPQVYANGELIGGLDIIKELKEGGELKDTLPIKEDINARLGKLINQSPVMLFMKGSPQQPKCGFSRTIISILDSTGVKYGHFDILENNEVREGLKRFVNWPTYPQLYVNGELIGGLDIVKELHESGDLPSTLAPS